MSENIQIIDLTMDNIDEYGLGCLKDKKHIGFKAKKEWLSVMFEKGLKLKAALDNKKLIGFIEYVDSENTYRPIEAKNYIVIHCIWVYPKVYQKKGYGQLLIEESIKDAKKMKKDGVAVLTSKGGWIASKDIFLKQDFIEIEKKSRFDLMIKKINDKAPNPKIINDNSNEYKGLNVLYAHQCPIILKFIEDIKKYCETEKINVNYIILDDAKKAQINPCPFGVFAVINNGKVLADNPISLTRFKNILNKELQK